MEESRSGVTGSGLMRVLGLEQESDETYEIGNILIASWCWQYRSTAYLNGHHSPRLT